MDYLDENRFWEDIEQLPDDWYDGEPTLDDIIDNTPEIINDYGFDDYLEDETVCNEDGYDDPF